jgi:hypothetical protein
MKKESKEQLLKKAEVYTMGVLMANDCLITCVSDALEALEILPLQRELKMSVTRLRDAKKKHVISLQKTINTTAQCHAEIMDDFDEIFKPDGDLLYFTIKQALDKRNVENAHILALLSKGIVIAQIAGDSFDAGRTRCRMSGVDLPQVLNLRYFVKLQDEIFKRVYKENGHDINLNHEPAIKTQVDIILKRFGNGTYLNYALKG